MDKSFQEGSWQRTSHGKKKILGSFWHVVTLWYRWQHHGKYKAIKWSLRSDWLQDYSRVLLCKIYFLHSKAFIDPACAIMMAGYQLCSFFAFFFTSTLPQSIKEGKKLCQYSATLTSCLVINPSVLTYKVSKFFDFSLFKLAMFLWV